MASTTATLAELAKLNDFTGYNSAYSYAALYAWVRAGFAPTNPLLRNAGADGVTIGAIELEGSPPRSVVSGSVTISGGVVLQ